jgi:DNA-binding beta-propeller fold protein YncE/mono/diheme cytochrome c family protein
VALAGCNEETAADAGESETSAETGDTGDEEPGYCLADLSIDLATADWEPSSEPPSVPVELSFAVTIDPAHPQLDPAAVPHRIDPRADAVTIGGGDPGYSLSILAKRPGERPELVWLEIYVQSEGEQGLTDAEIELTGFAGSVWAIGRDPWSDPVAEPRFPLGHVAPGANNRVVIAIDAPVDAGELSFSVNVHAQSSTRRAMHSAPLAVSPDGAEVWSPFADADTLAVVDTNTDTRVAQITLPGRPTGTAITPDGAWVLSTTASCNQLVVIDRATREIVQVLGEAQGIGRDPRHVLTSPDGRWAFVSSYVGDSVTVLRRVEGGYRVAKTIAVDRRPLGFAVDPDSTHLYVAHWMPRGPVMDNEAWVSDIDLTTLALADELILTDEANLDRTDCIAMIFAGQPAEALTFEGSFSQLSGVFVDPSGGRGMIPGVRLAPFPILEGDPQASGVDVAISGANTPLHMMELDLRETDAPQWNPLDITLDIPDRSEGFLSCVRPTNVNEFVTPFEDPNQPGIRTFPGKTSPASAAPTNTTGPGRFMTWTPDGRALFLLGTAADHLIVLDGGTLSSTHTEQLTLAGENPIGLAFTPDGRKAYVLYENTPELGVLDTSAYAEQQAEPHYTPVWLADGLGGGVGGLLTFKLMTLDTNGMPELPAVSEVGSVPLVDADPMDPLLRRGKILFESSNPDKYPELSNSPQATCQSCHPYGGVDGAGWATVEGERRTIGLWGGTGGRGWLHYSGTHNSAEEFATIIVEERLGGTGLSDADVHALANYVAWGIPTVQPPAVDEALAAQGQMIFASKCASCHSGDKFGSGAPLDGHPYGGADPSSTPGLFDVGTATDSAGIMMGSAFVMLFPQATKDLFETMRGDRELGPNDPVQQTLGYTARPERARGQFKAPSLVNLRENSAFLHDGRFGELSEVVDYFDATLGLGMTDADKLALLEYLETI